MTGHHERFLAIRRKGDPTRLVILIGLFLGIGIGVVYNQVLFGTLIGVSTGFLVWGLIKVVKKK